jgi:putative phosphoribosyl transferase
VHDEQARPTKNFSGGTYVIFANRSEAGRSFAWRLQKYANRHDVVVLGVPRGGVPVAFEIAEALRAPLDLFLLRKLGVPGHEEFAFGAIASAGGVCILDPQILRTLAIASCEVEAITAGAEQELKRQEAVYRSGEPPLSVAGKIAILVDDGIATGASLFAGIHALRQLRPAKIVVAVPVAPAPVVERLADEVDEIVCVATPEPFGAVGQFYDDFSQVEDDKVIELLARSRRTKSATAA